MQDPPRDLEEKAQTTRSSIQPRPSDARSSAGAGSLSAALSHLASLGLALYASGGFCPLCPRARAYLSLLWLRALFEWPMARREWEIKAPEIMQHIQGSARGRETIALAPARAPTASTCDSCRFARGAARGRAGGQASVTATAPTATARCFNRLAR